jgi:hypothetical protein
VPIVEGMQDDDLAIYTGAGTEGFVQLSRTQQGVLFEKHILNYGDLLYPQAPGGKLKIDDSFVDAMIDNFNKKVCDIVQVPIADKNNQHSEDPRDNIGEVVGLTKRNGKVYAQIDARDEDAAKKLGKTMLGASAMFATNYKDTNTDKRMGPTLLHVAVTNRPYVTGLEDFSEMGDLARLSADGNGEAVILTATESKEKKMTLDELKAELKADHNIDVDVLLSNAEKADEKVELSNKITDALSTAGVLKLSNGETASADELVTAIANVHEVNVALTAKVDELVADKAKGAAVERINGLIREGRVLPAQKDAQVTLLLSNPELFEQLVPATPIVKLSNATSEGERGFDIPEGQHEKSVDDEIARLSALPAAQPYVRGHKA